MKDIASVVLVIAAGLAVAAFAVYAAGDKSVLVPPPDATAENFVRELGMGRYDVVLHHLSDDVRRQVGASELRASFEPLRALTGRPDQVVTHRPATYGDHARVLTLYQGRRATAALYVDLVRQHGMWKIATWPLDIVQRP